MVSVAHRPSAIQYHGQVLRLRPNNCGYVVETRQETM